MAAIPGDKPESISRVRFDGRITLGNILTITGGIVIGAVFLVTMIVRLNQLEEKVEDIRCTLAQAGIAPTTGACVLAAHQFIEKQLPPAH